MRDLWYKSVTSEYDHRMGVASGAMSIGFRGKLLRSNLQMSNHCESLAESWDIATAIVWWIQILSGNLWSSTSLYQTIFRSNTQMAYSVCAWSCVSLSHYQTMNEGLLPTSTQNGSQRQSIRVSMRRGQAQKSTTLQSITLNHACRILVISP